MKYYQLKSQNSLGNSISQDHQILFDNHNESIRYATFYCRLMGDELSNHLIHKPDTYLSFFRYFKESFSRIIKTELLILKA